MSDDVWHVPSDDDPTETVKIRPVTITPPITPPTGTGNPRDRLRDAVVAIENHRYQGFYDWFGIGELIAAARGVLRETNPVAPQCQ